MNSFQVTLLVLLDLGAAFDTVNNYEELLKRLHPDVGIRGTALDWFKSYLNGRGECIAVQGTMSRQVDLDCGVLQGSCLGPLLFVIYASNLFKIVEKHLPTIHCFANDRQPYLSFKPDDSTCQNDAMNAMNKCVDDLRNWMITDKLMINDDKTEFLLIGTRQQLLVAKINTACSITVSEYDIDPIL